MLCKTILVWHHFEITFATEETLKPVGTWNKGNMYTVSLFLVQLCFWFSLFKIKSFLSTQLWALARMTNANSVCGDPDFDDSRLLNVGRWFKLLLEMITWWHVKIRWWVLQIRRNWWLRNIDVFPIEAIWWHQKTFFFQILKKEQKVKK